MKKGLFLLIVALLTSSISMMAQDNKVKKDRPTKEQRVEMMTKRMSSQLMLSDSQSAQFAPLYKTYLSDMEALRPQKGDNKGKVDDSQKDKMIRDGFAQQRKMIDLREKYYNEFTKFLTPSQAQKVIGPNSFGMNRGDMKDGMMKKHDGKKDGKRDGKRDRMMNDNGMMN